METASEMKDYGVPNEHLEATISQVSEIIRDNFQEIATTYPSIYHTPFSTFYAVTMAEWRDLFGDSPPGPLTEWDPVRETGSTKFIVTYQHNAELNRDHSLSLEKFEHILDDPTREVLPIRVTPALALSEAGSMSLLQARAYVLRKWGYDQSDIADLLEKPAGTVSSHLNRGRKKATQAEWMTEYISTLKELRPADYEQVFSRIGTVYERTDGGYERIVGVAKEDDELYYDVLHGHGRNYIPVERFLDNRGDYKKCDIDDDKVPPHLRDAEVMDVPDEWLPSQYPIKDQ